MSHLNLEQATELKKLGFPVLHGVQPDGSDILLLPCLEELIYWLSPYNLDIYAINGRWWELQLDACPKLGGFVRSDLVEGLFDCVCWVLLKESKR